jgi:hypothetical protein
MCLCLPDTHLLKKAPEPKVAEEDILVFKVLELYAHDPDEGEGDGYNLISPFRGFEYTDRLGVEQRAKFTYSAPYQNIFRGDPDFDRLGQWRVQEGFHACPTYEETTGICNYSSSRVTVAIIPKGARYYTGTFDGRGDSIVADRMTVLPLDHELTKSFVPARRRQFPGLTEEV